MACITGVMYLVQERLLKQHRIGGLFYQLPPIQELAKAIDLKIGDKITIGVLGVERSARIASLRRIDWDSMGFNYVLVFSPNTLADAPHNEAVFEKFTIIGKLVN